MSDKRKTENRIDNGLVSNDEPSFKQLKGMWTSSFRHSKLKNSEKKNIESSRPLIEPVAGNPFRPIAVEIKDYIHHLVEGREYYIAEGDVGDHAFYYTGIFDGLDKDGGAVFIHYSQLLNDGQKSTPERSLTIQPNSDQYHIYHLTMRSDLPADVMRHAFSFMGGRTQRMKRHRRKSHKRKSHKRKSNKMKRL